MSLGDGQRLEAVEVGLDLRPQRDLEADLAVDSDHLLAHLREQVLMADARPAARQADVDHAVEIRGLDRFIEGPQPGGHCIGDAVLDPVERLADGAAVLGRDGPQMLHELGYLPLLAHVLGLEVAYLLLVGQGLDLASELLAEIIDASDEFVYGHGDSRANPAWDATSAARHAGMDEAMKIRAA